MKNLFLNYIKNDLKPPYLMITCGLPATLKTTLAREVAAITGCRLLRSDVVRREIMGNDDIYDERIASDQDRRAFVYSELFRRAAACESPCLILDATFFLQSFRRQAAALAAARRIPFVIVETVSPKKNALERIKQRDKNSTDSNAISSAAYFENERIFEPVDIVSLAEEFPGLFITHLKVDTAQFDPSSWIILNQITCGRST